MSFNKTKTDPELGLEIHKHLVSLGVETPVTDKILTTSEKVNIIQDKFYDIMVTLGLDLIKQS